MTYQYPLPAAGKQPRVGKNCDTTSVKRSVQIDVRSRKEILSVSDVPASSRQPSFYSLKLRGMNKNAERLDQCMQKVNKMSRYVY
jgi:hypothetical protein